MKMSFFLIIILYISGFGQNLDNGNISLTLNDELISIPIAEVKIQKGDLIHFNVLASKFDETKNQKILLDFSCDKLLPDALTSNGFKVEIFNQRKSDLKSTEYDLNEKFIISLAENKEVIQYEKSDKDKKFSLNPKSISLRFNVLEYKYEDNIFIVRGKFEAKLKNGINQEEEFVQIENGEFEIRI